jgi:poly-beta-1,6-N-acetyl-D-glucosamine biosynthesis protein PgaD
MSHTDWPPIISGTRRPRWILWRDVAITLFMWGVFLVITEIEFALIWQKPPFLSGRPAGSADFGFQMVRQEIRPALGFILVLVAVLGVATLVSRRRRASALLQPQPSPAPDDQLARDLGMSQVQLQAIRQRKIVILNVNERGNVSVAPTAPPQAEKWSS